MNILLVETQCSYILALIDINDHDSIHRMMLNTSYHDNMFIKNCHEISSLSLSAPKTLLDNCYLTGGTETPAACVENGQKVGVE